MPPRKLSRVAALLLALVMLLTLIPFQSLASDSPAAKTGSDTANETLYSVSDADASAAAQAEGDDTSSSAVEIPLFSDYLWVALMEVEKGVWDYDAIEYTIRSLIEEDECEELGFDTSLFTIDFPRDIKENGEYKAVISYPETDTMPATSTTITINVTISPMSKVEFDQLSDSAVLEYDYNDSGVEEYNYDKFKQYIFDNVVRVTLRYYTLDWEDIVYEYKVCDSEGNNGTYQPFETETVPGDTDGSCKYLRDGGTFDVKLTLPETDEYYGGSYEFKLNVNTVIPNSPEIVVREGQSLQLLHVWYNSYDFEYEDLKKDIFDKVVVEIKNLPEGCSFDWDDLEYTYEIVSKDGSTSGYYDFEDLTGPQGGGQKFLKDGGDFNIRLSFDEDYGYHGASVVVKVNITPYDPYASYIAFKGDFPSVTLREITVGNFDYDAFTDALESAFNEVVDRDNTRPGYMDGYYCDFYYPELTESGVYNVGIKFIGDNNFKASPIIYVDIPINVEKLPTAELPVKADKVDAELNEVKVGQYDLESFKKSIFEKAIDTDAASAAGLTYSDMDITFDRTVNSSGEYTATITYPGTNKLHGVSVTVTVNVTRIKHMATTSVSLKQDYKYFDESYPSDLLQIAASDSLDRTYFLLDTSSSQQAIIYIDSVSGVDIATGLSSVFESVLGRSGEDVCQNGLSRSELVALLNSQELAECAATNYNVDDSAISAMKDIVNNISESVTNIKLVAGQPTKPGTYTMFAMATNEDYNTAYVSCAFYVKYHSSGTKLLFVQDTDGLNSSNVGSFDYSAVVTKDGIPVQSDNVKYIYTGFRSNALFYGSTSEGPRQAGIYTQTAWTLGGTYAFPKTRTFVVSR